MIMEKKLNVAVLIYPLVELVDMNGPIDAFLHANSYNGSRYNVYTVGNTGLPIPGEDKAVTLTPTHSIHNCPEPDIIVIPGVMLKTGPGIAEKPMIEWINKMAGKSKKGVGQKYILSVCIGLYTLVETGLLKGKRATTHYLSIKDFQAKHPDVTLIKNVRFVEDGNIISTGGITSGIDGALHLVEKLDGSVIAQQASDIMVYNRDNPMPPYTLLPPYDSI